MGRPGKVQRKKPGSRTASKFWKGFFKRQGMKPEPVGKKPPIKAKTLMAQQRKVGEAPRKPIIGMKKVEVGGRTFQAKIKPVTKKQIREPKGRVVEVYPEAKRKGNKYRRKNN